MSTPVCPRCHAPIPPDSPQGLCPKCALGVGLGNAELFLTGAREPQKPPPTPEDLQPLFPHLEIIALIGRGGMGAVYEALQRGLNRRVALKVLWAPAIPDAEFEQRFAREGRALAQLSHANVVAVHDAGKSGPYYWIIMEYVDGANLRALLRAGPIEPSRALAFVMQMCAALDYAHRKGVVHRDIKPENVLITKTGRVKIADFGLAKMLARKNPSAALTRSEQTMGTPHYIAPEQIERPKEVDHRADIYSLGVVLYEVLTGELPLGRFQLPSRKVDVDTRIDDVVVKALQKQPEQRFQTASEVSTAIGSASHERVRARPRAARPTQRKAVPWPMIGAASVVLLGVWFVVAKLGVLQAGSSDGVLSPEAAFAKGKELVANPDSLEEGIAHLESAYERMPGLQGLQDRLDTALRHRVENLKSDGDFDEALLVARRAQEITPSPDNESLASSMYERARAYWAQVVQVLSPKENEVLGESAVAVHGRVTGAGLNARLTLDGTPIEIINATFKRDLGPLKDGPYELELMIAAPSRLEIPLERHFIVDTQPPQLTVVAPEDGAIVGGAFEVRGSVVDSTKTTIDVGDQLVEMAESGEWRVSLSLEEGPRGIVVTSRDVLGRTATRTVQVVVDTRPPTVDDLGRGFEIAWGLQGDGITMKVADDNGVRSVWWDGRAIDFDSTGLIRLPTGTVIDEGVAVPHLLLVMDTAGNQEEQEVVLRRDGTAPKITPKYEADVAFPDSQYDLRGSFLDRSPCFLVLNGKEILLNGDEFNVPVAISPNCMPGETIPLSFTIRDVANNKASATTTLKIIAPCGGCKAVDGHRGNCPKCDGSGQIEKDCSRCKGEKEALTRCDVCGGTGKAKCTVCTGTGDAPPIACNECNEGKLTCGRCNGSGRVPSRCTSPDCFAGYEYTNTIPQRKVPCPKCQTTQQVLLECGTCKGKQVVDCKKCDDGQVKQHCPHCKDGKTTATCEECQGKHKVKRECELCSGEGKRRFPCDLCKGDKNCTVCGGTGRADAARTAPLESPLVPRR